MGDETGSDNKRKFDDSSPVSTVSSHRLTGFSAPVTSPLSGGDSGGAPPAYNNVPPPVAVDGIEAAKLKAQEIAARLFSDAEAKRPRVENGATGDGAGDRGFSSGFSDQYQKPLGQQSSNIGLGDPGSYSAYGYSSGTSKRIDIPNGRVGVIIGKGGETIKYLQQQSGAKIQVTRDMDADPNSPTRMVELMGTPEQISKAEQMIDDVLKDADAGGSGTVGHRMGSGQGGNEQVIMKIPANKVGLVIGKGGETIKSMQQRSGARIQVFPLHPPPGDTSTERNVQLDGTQDQIEAAKQLVIEVISDNRMRNSQMGGGYSQQSYCPPRPPTNWGPPGPPNQQPGYGYMQPGAYPGAPQYNMSQPSYGGYPQQPASGGYPTGWDQSSNQSTQPNNAGTGYDYYGQQQTQQQQQPVPVSTGDNNSYNYGQQQPPSYNSQGTYAEGGGFSQQPGYGQDSYSGGYHAPGSQTGYAQGAPNPQAGYDQQQGYGPASQYGNATNTTAESSAPNYGSEVAPVQQTAPAHQPSPSPQGYGQVPGYSMPPAAQPGYGQAPYGQPPQGEKPPSSEPVYGQGQPPSSQSSYPSCGYGPTASQQGYGQQHSYGGAQLPSQPGYGAQQQYYDSYASGGYSQAPAYSSDNTAHGTNDSTAAQVPAGVTKSPQS